MRLICRQLLLQLLQPIRYHVDHGRGGHLLVFFDHQEATSIRTDIEIARVKSRCGVWSVKQDYRLRWMEGGLERDRDCHHLIAVEVKQLVSICGPDWRISAVAGYLSCTARAGEGPNVDLVAARFVGVVCNPSAVAGEGCA